MPEEEIPRAFIPVIGKEPVYNSKVIFDDSGHNADCKYGVAEKYAWDTVKRMYSVRRPASDSIQPALCVIFPGAMLESNAALPVAVAAFEKDSRPVLASVRSDSDAPAIGSNLGTVAGQWGLKVGNTGFVCVGISIDEGAGGRRFVYVRPSGGGGGGTTLTLVQATDSGANGVVPVKVIQLKADPSLSPNFEQTGDAFNINYFKV